MGEQHKGKLPINRRNYLKLSGLGASGLVAGCTDGGTGSGDGQQDTVTWQVDVGESSTTSFQIIQGVQKVVNDNSDRLEIDARAQKGSAQTIANLATGETDLAFATNVQAIELMNQEGRYEDLNKNHDIFQLIHYFSIEFSLATYPDQTGIRTMEDLPGNIVSFGSSAGAAHNNFPEWLDPFIDMENVEIRPMPFDEIHGALDGGRIDAGAALSINSNPPSYTQPILSNDSSWIIGWPDNVVEVFGEHPGLAGNIRTAEEVTGSDESLEAYGDREEVFWPAVPYHLYATDTLNEELVEEFLSTIWENREELPEFHSALDPWVNKSFLTNYIDPVPVHPTAESFFESV